MTDLSIYMMAVEMHTWCPDGLETCNCYIIIIVVVVVVVIVIVIVFIVIMDTWGGALG